MKVKKFILLALLLGAGVPSTIYADDYVDDIYFNPKKDTKAGAKKKNSNYIENFSDIDVDAYNHRGQYYSSPIDTIGTKAGSDEDFVYTQQIQKYYNPTIVLDNSDVLADVLANSYGNVEIVYNGFTPSFLPVYSYGWPYYRGYYDPWAWNIGFGGWYDPWGWGPGWSSWWGPSWSWGWGPSWGPSWGWGSGWGPGWNRPGWDWGWSRPNSTWSPGGNRPVRPGSGWASNNRRPNGVSSRPGHSSSDSNWSIGGNHRGNYRGSSSNSGMQNSAPNRGGYYVGSDGHRYSGNGNSNGSYGGNTSVGNRRGAATTSRGTVSNQQTNSSRNTYNSNRNTNSTRNYNTNSSTNRGSYNSNRSTGNGSFGGGSFGGGSRSGGGGSSRGHRR